VRRAGLAFKRGCSVDTQNADGRRGVRGSGLRTRDIWSEDTTKLGTAAMGAAVAEAV